MSTVDYDKLWDYYEELQCMELRAIRFTRKFDHAFRSMTEHDQKFSTAKDVSLEMDKLNDCLHKSMNHFTLVLELYEGMLP